MKRILFVLICMSLTSITQAVIVAFDAEDPLVYYQAGALWTDVDDEDALQGVCITATENLPAQTDENTRFYSFNMPAGTYNLYVRVNVDDNNRTTQAAADNDSFYLSNDSLLEDAGTIDFNGIGGDNAPPLEGGVGAVTNAWGWVLARQSYNIDVIRTYTMDFDGTAYFKISPREDGLYIDAFAFVTEGQTVTGEELDAAVQPVVIRGAATDPDPADSLIPEVVAEETTELSWAPTSDPNVLSVEGYDVYFGTDPNIPNNPQYSTDVNSLPLNGVDGPDPLVINTTYHWRVDSHVVWDANDIDDTGPYSDIVEGYEWEFTTYPDDITPVVTADNVLTYMGLLPASLTGTVDDKGEDDIVTVEWEVLGTNATDAAKQMIVRTQDLSAITSEPNLLMDWIGTDTREPGNPLYLILKGLPNDTYTWTSYHHDADNQSGVFDVTVIDASGSAKTTDIQISSDNTPPATTFTTTITSNGIDDVALIFDLQDATEVAQQFFVMNGFELTGTGDPLYIDFGTVVSETDANAVNVMPGYQAYTARHEVSETFTEQSYSAFGTTVSIQPSWGGVDATVTDTINDPSSPTQTAILETDWWGEYLVQLSATDTPNPDALTGSDIAVVTVAADACSAAQMSTNWPGFSASDFTEDCVVTLEDFAGIAAAWMEDRNLTGQE